MARSSRRVISSFSLSFLDIMFCGFGAVVLLVLIINTNTIDSRADRLVTLQDEQLQKAKRNQLAQKQLDTLDITSNELMADIDRLEAARSTSYAEVSGVEAQLKAAVRSTPVPTELAELKRQLKERESQYQQVLQEIEKSQESGRQVRPFEGEGNRQYLTGLKLGGKRVLILVDSSASMLDSRVVDIVRRKILDDPVRRSAPKWQRVVATVEWIVANLPVDSTIRALHFSSAVVDLYDEEDTGWIDVVDREKVDRLVANLKDVAPLHGTNLEAVFKQAKRLSPRPDNIVLITDGLPTLGSGRPPGKTIGPRQRSNLFDKALEQLPANIPVNVILFPLEGDPLAAVSYWKLALDSNGSLFTPTRDWP